jgi:hypothetical protein
MAALVCIVVLTSFLGLLREQTLTTEIPAATQCRCGYDFIGLADTGTCPECGEAFDQRTPTISHSTLPAVSFAGLPTIALALVLFVTMLILSEPAVQFALAPEYYALGFSWETSMRAPLVRELADRPAWAVLWPWTAISAILPWMGRIQNTRLAMRLVLVVHVLTFAVFALVPCVVSLIRVSTW